jgi:four helix bundle protein
MAHFAKISRGSLYELDTLLELASEFGYSKKEKIESARKEITTLTKRISSFIKYQENKSN